MSASPHASRKTHEILPVVYDELRGLARKFLRRERVGHTLQATELVHEVYLRLSRQRKSTWENRTEFFAAAAMMIRRIVINHEKRRRTLRKGGALRLVSLEEECLAIDDSGIDLIALDDLLHKLARMDERQAQIVELRFFAGMSIDQVASVLRISPRTVSGEWALARAWLRTALSEGEPL